MSRIWVNKDSTLVMQLFIATLTLLFSISSCATVPAKTGSCGTPPISPKLPGLHAAAPRNQNDSACVDIVGGNTAKPYSWPWMVAVFYKDSFECGGTLIADSWVLTAAHCMVRDGSQVPEEDITLKLAVVNIEKTDPNEQIAKAKNIIIHDGFVLKTYFNDVALIQLRSPVKVNEYVMPVCLPDKDNVIATGDTGIVTGWGYTSEFGPISDVLKQVIVPVVDHDTCSTDMAPKPVYSSMFCAGAKMGGADACNADSGGPFVVSHQNRFVQQGIVSWGEGCAEPDKPGVYTLVASFRKWIDGVIIGTNNKQ